jgi:DNA recombination protein RmuC
MPDPVLLGLLVAILVLQLLLLLLVFFRRDASLLTRKLEESDRQAREESERLRALFEHGQRDQTTQSLKEIGSLREGLKDEFGNRFRDVLGAVSEATQAARKEQNERLDALQRTLSEGQRDARKAQDDRLERVETAQRTFGERFVGGMESQKTTLGELSAAISKQQAETAQNLGKALTERLDHLRSELSETLNKLQSHTGERLDAMRQDNEKALEKVRATVDEKLQKTLETRLGEQFRTVTEQLDRVSRGLGEMQGLAQGVGDLKRVLTNVKSRGTFGEVQLGALLEQVLSPSQFAQNVQPIPGSRKIVEFAVCLPGRDENLPTIYLPIDSKFPMEDYERLQAAYDEGDKVALDRARVELGKRLIAEGASIRDSYVSPPYTTDFGILFLPTEGLYAEAIRMPGLLERLQSECRVVLAGPMTLYAILNSLQMGFRTLAIEKRSSEVWTLLSAVKTEFGKFGETLQKVQTKIESASKEFEKVGVRSRAISKKLKDVQEIDYNSATTLLGDSETEIEEVPETDT